VRQNAKLKKISDAVFQEAEPRKDQSRSFEWRRRFNVVILPLKNIQIVNSCTIHDTDFDLDEEKKANPVELVKSRVATTIAITSILAEGSMRDSIYFAVEEEKGGDIYGIERHRGKTKITLRSGEPTEAGGDRPAGLYWGNAFRMNFDPGEDDLCFELCMSERQISSLVASLRANENSLVEVSVHLLSFTFEVDDALREPYHPMDIVMNDSALCFLSWARVASKVGWHELERSADDPDEEVENEEHTEPTAEERSRHGLIQAVTSYSKPLSSLVTAVWVLIIVIVLHGLLA
jgi:hypothetical protein